MNAPEDDVDLSGLSDGRSDDAEDSDEFVIGSMVGRYQLCVELASGGMAKVYLARRIGEGGFDKLVALKRIHPHLSSQAEFAEMFMDEARIASRIDHPNVCAVFDFGRAGREQFIAMEYLLGETLGRVWRRARTQGVTGTPAWWALSMRIVAEAAEGLHAAHELASETGEPLLVVHRDVSPSNVFVTYEGAVKVVDFGVARAQNKVHQTRDGRVKGHYAYMAPEQARAGNVDRRADLWSLGVLLWELLAGQRLFRRESEAATLMAVICGEVPSLAGQCPTLPTEVTELVERLLADDPELRPTSARAVSRDLERAIARVGGPIGRGDLAQLMEQLFPEEMERRKQMVAAARRMPTVTRLERGEPGEARGGALRGPSGPRGRRRASRPALAPGGSPGPPDASRAGGRRAHCPARSGGGGLGPRARGPRWREPGDIRPELARGSAARRGPARGGARRRTCAYDRDGSARGARCGHPRRAGARLVRGRRRRATHHGRRCGPGDRGRRRGRTAA
jgi:hypothetical protein